MAEASPKRRLAVTSSSSGGSLASHGALLDAIAASPDDDGPWSVFADLLQTTDHPRGELISVMMERERRPVGAATRGAAQPVRRACGRAAAGVVGSRGRGGMAARVRERAALDSPAQLGEVQRDLSLRFVDGRHARDRAGALGRVAHRAGGVWMPWRRVLRIEVRAATDDALEVAPILACAPGLETLRVAFAADAPGTVSCDEARGPQLQRLVLVNAGEVPALDDVELPRLESCGCSVIRCHRRTCARAWAGAGSSGSSSPRRKTKPSNRSPTDRFCDRADLGPEQTRPRRRW